MHIMFVLVQNQQSILSTTFPWLNCSERIHWGRVSNFQCPCCHQPSSVSRQNISPCWAWFYRRLEIIHYLHNSKACLQLLCNSKTRRHKNNTSHMNTHTHNTNMMNFFRFRLPNSFKVPLSETEIRYHMNREQIS